MSWFNDLFVNEAKAALHSQSGSGGSGGDWNASIGEPGYIANRTHYKETTFVSIIDTVVSYDAYESAFLVNDFTLADVGDVYRISIEGDAEQEFVLPDDKRVEYVCLSNGKIYNLDFSTGWVFIYITVSDESRDNFAIRVSKLTPVYHVIEREYLPSLVGRVYEGSEEGEVFNRYDGYNVASGSYSHAEGSAATASGSCSHAEGSGATASGDYSHAEGRDTKATGRFSHAEGQGSTAASPHQHVQGKFPLVDSESKYAHIVGNGSGVTRRSNAHTLDWNGVGWFRGGLRVGGNAQDDGAQSVVLNGDKELIIASSTEGSNKKFKITIDDTGILTATELTV